MTNEAFLYDLDERPPLGRNIFYGVQCAVLVILSTQVGLGIQTVTRGKTRFSARDGLVVGLAVLLGTALPLLPYAFFQKLPMLLAALLRNGLAVGMLFVILLEHLIMREDKGD